MTRIPNPVLPGFHPDPCIIWARGYYYLATSTFEWWPGVQIHRSRDLTRWELAGYALTRRAQIDMRGNLDSGGVWAPALSYADGQFWLVYSDVKSHWGSYKDVRNYLVWADSVDGPWSDPVPLTRSGFDPSLFHDTDGRKWLVNQIWKPSSGRDAFAGIVLQEYSVSKRQLVGKPVNIFQGSSIGMTEGPHLYRKDDHYYLLTAEGGTEWEHAVTIARSRSLQGPYEVSPDNPLLTSRANPKLYLQKAGHGSLVQAPDGHWYLAHLCSRPVGAQRRCILGRETAVQNIVWPKNEWPRLAGGGREPADFFEVNGPEEGGPYFPEFVDNFEGSELGLHWNTLREPSASGWLSLSERPGFLRLRGRNSLQSFFEQSLVGLRIAHGRCTVATCLDFAPVSFQQSAGLAFYYNTANFYYAYVTMGGNGLREIRLLSCNNRHYREMVAAVLPAGFPGPIELRAELHDGRLQFFLRLGSDSIKPIGSGLDATILSDDYPSEGGIGLAFTGAFAVLCAQDSSEERIPADFDWFTYRASEAAASSMPPEVK